MKVQFMSDLHLEFHTWKKRPGERLLCDFIDALDPSGVEVLILAGDICSKRMIEFVMERFCELFPHVIYVPGNHEYYREKTSDVETALAEVDEKFDNLHLLNPGKVTIDGITFVGATLWFEEPNPADLAQGKWGLGDYRFIGDFEPWVYEKNKGDQTFIVENIDEADVVITHHMPSYKCVSEFFKNSRLNPFFVCPMDVVIHAYKLPLWVHGHTHRSINITIGETAIRCNPRGYPGTDRNRAFDRKLLLDVESNKAEK